MREAYELPTFLGGTVPVEFAAGLDGFEVRGRSVLLRCATNRYEPRVYGYYGTRCETLFEPPASGRPATLRLDFEADEILRLRYAPGAEVPENETPMVVGSFGGPSRLDASEDGRSVTFETAALRVVVEREPLRIVVYDRAGGVVWATRPVDVEPMRRSERQWDPRQERWLFLHRYAYPLGVAPAGAYGPPQAFASFDLRHDERVYGFGEDYGPLDRRGTRQKLWLQEAFSNAVPAAYKQVPFYLSSRGYGLFVNTSNALNFRVGELEHTALSVTVEDAAFLDLYFIYGPSPKEILPRYHEITGRPAVPPKWTFGLWMGRITYERQDEVERVARKLRERRVPCDVIHLDTGWFEKESVCDLEFGKEKFPDPAAMIKKLRDENFRVSLWQWPNMVLDSKMFDEGREGGFLAKRENGAAYTATGYGEDAGFIDYSNPGAVEWVKGKFRKLFGMGAAAIKTDFGEGAPPDAFYHSVPGAAMHNLYPLLYNRAVFEVTEEFAGEGKGVVWSRSAWAGSQRYPVHWSGDGIARFEDLACVLRSALSFGLSGFPFYSHDVGGFVGVPSPELYVRWAQLGFFSSHVRCHGAPPREPWEYGEEAERVFRFYDELRYRLLPYVWSEAVECGKSGLPMLRPLFLDFSDDPTVRKIEDQYLFGRNLLVAPILDESDWRTLYLPRGRWVDYWTKEVLEGGCWIERPASLDTIPLYVRGGTMIPHGPVMQHAGERPMDPLTVELYALRGEGGYTVHDEDRPDVPISYRRDGDGMKVEVGAAPGRVELIVYGEEVSDARADEEALEMRHTEAGGVGASFDGTAPRTVVLRTAGR
jgi:alpha-D-xyloside xylohydrolase